LTTPCPPVCCRSHGGKRSPAGKPVRVAPNALFQADGRPISQVAGRRGDVEARLDYITTESAQDVEGLMSGLGRAADGLIVVGGACPPALRSPRMNEFVRRFTQASGSWNDEAGTKVYALEFVLATLQMAGRGSVDDIDRFKSVIPSFCIDDPFVTGRSSLAYFGTREFNQKRQIGIPLVVNTIRGGRLETLFMQKPEEILT
jgi:branched-chain amino acid transport system substrate-binding protein